MLSIIVDAFFKKLIKKWMNDLDEEKYNNSYNNSFFFFSSE